MRKAWLGRPWLATARDLLAAVGTMVVVTSCDGAPLSTQLVEVSTGTLRSSATTGQYSDDDILRGALFADGPVARAIPEIRDHLLLSRRVSDPEHLAALRSVHDRIITQINGTDPQFVASFARDMRSGNPVDVEAAYRLGARRAAEAAATLPEIDSLRRQLRTDPEFREQLAATMRQGMRAAGEASQAELEALIAARLAALIEGEDLVGPDFEYAGIILGPAIFIYAWLFVWLQAAVFQDVAITLNLAIAANAYLWLFFHVFAYNTSPCAPEVCMESSPMDGDLQHEQLIASTTRVLAS